MLQQAKKDEISWPFHLLILVRAYQTKIEKKLCMKALNITFDLVEFNDKQRPRCNDVKITANDKQPPKK